jgi:hypothetical protein
MSASDTKLVWVRLRLRFVDIFVKMWLLKAFFLVILPVPVMLKRFLALELVFIFGMSDIICLLKIILLEVKGKGLKAKGKFLISNLQSLISISDVRFRICFSPDL